MRWRHASTEHGSAACIETEPRPAGDTGAPPWSYLWQLKWTSCSSKARHSSKYIFILHIFKTHHCFFVFKDSHAVSSHCVWFPVLTPDAVENHARTPVATSCNLVGPPLDLFQFLSSEPLQMWATAVKGHTSGWGGRRKDGARNGVNVIFWGGCAISMGMTHQTMHSCLANALAEALWILSVFGYFDSKGGNYTDNPVAHFSLALWV